MQINSLPGLAINNRKGLKCESIMEKERRRELPLVAGSLTLIGASRKGGGAVSTYRRSHGHGRPRLRPVPPHP